LAQHVTKRKKGNKTYYYLAQTERINGKPKQKTTMSLGTAEDIERALLSANNQSIIDRPDFCRIYQFGAEVALLNIAERLGVANIIDELVPKRNQGLSVGAYMVLAAINRAVQPTSKNSFFNWFQKTVLSRSFPAANENTLSGQSFWNHMLELDKDVLVAIEDEITKNVVEKYNISTDCLLFDNTNFITYIDSSNPALIPQRGHSKEKRSDLKIVGLSLMTSSNLNIPLFHETYPGNTHDSKQFINIIDKLKQRLSKISNKKDNITLVFDKGNNSDCAIEALENADLLKLHFVGGLRLNQCPELLEIKNEFYTPLVGAAFGDTSAYRLKKKIYGREFTVIITDNPKLRDSQLVGLKDNIRKCETELLVLQDALKRREEGKIVKGRKRTPKTVGNNINKILSHEHMKKLFKVNITCLNDNIELTYDFIDSNYNNLLNYHLGKTILFTNRDDWTTEQIVATYRSQFHVEGSFKQMKNIKYLTFRPIRHFTDKMIIVHTFYCVLAYTLCCLLQHEMEELGYKMSINAVLTELSQAKQSLNIYSNDSVLGSVKVIPVFSETSPAAEAYLTEYDLRRYALK
jgi:transposase